MSAKRKIAVALIAVLNYTPVLLSLWLYAWGYKFYLLLAPVFICLAAVDHLVADTVIGQVFLSGNFVLSAVVASVCSVDFYTAHVSGDEMSYGLGFAAVILNTLLVLILSFISICVKNRKE